MATRPTITVRLLCYYIVPSIITGFAYGWEVASMGGILAMPQFLNYMGTPSDFRQGLMTAALIAGEVVGSLLVGFIFADRFGRRTTIFVSIALYLVGQALLVAAQNQAMFIVGRAINGLGAGPWFQTISFYTAEITPPHIRGRVTATLNTGIAIGLVVAYWIQYGALGIPGHGAWRLCFGLQLVPGVVVGVIMFWRPESPRWLIQNGRPDEAIRVLANLHGNGDINDEFVRAEYEEIRTVVELEESPEAPSYLKLIIGKEYRRRTGLAMGLQCMQQLSGANIVLYYAAKVFAQTGRTGTSAALLANGISSALLFGATLSLTIMIDYYGRRKPIFLGHISMGVCLVIVASILVSYGSPRFDQTTQAIQFTFEKAAAGETALAFMFLFQIAFGALSSSVPWTYQSEVFPVIARARGTSLAVTANFFTNFWLGLYIPRALNTASWKLYYIFGAINFTCAVIGYIFYPETAGKSLEQLDLLFTPDRTVWVFLDKAARKKMSIGTSQAVVDPEGLASELAKQHVAEKIQHVAIDAAEDKTERKPVHREGTV